MDDLYLLAFAQNMLSNIPVATITAYARKFNPLPPSTPSPIEHLLKNICIFLSKKQTKQLTNQKIKRMLMEQAQQLGEDLKKGIDKLMQNNYIDTLKKNFQIIAEKYQQNQKSGKEKGQNRSGGRNKQNNNSVNNKNPTSNQSKLSKKIKNGENNRVSATTLQNIKDSQTCVCSFESEKSERCYICALCNNSFHLDCIKVLHAETKVCIFCHLKNLSPLNRIIQTVFVGILRKQEKIHEIMFDLNEDLLKESRYMIEIRSIRMKTCATSSILFPDYTNISLNGQFVKQYLPLIRQSSLKYRKDETFYLTKSKCKDKANRVLIQTKITNKLNKEERIEPENHLIGIYIVQETSIEQKLNQIKEVSLNNYQQSFRLLNKTLEGHVQDISVELIKIPLTCIFTGEQLKIPVRGIFCEHFQCFDLYNYLIFTAKSQHPRWACPFCKSPAYQFKIDCLLFAIIKENITEIATEVLFFSNNTYTIFNKLGLVGASNNKISSLKIQSICKRQLQVRDSSGGRKRRQKNNLSIQIQKIICLQQE